MTQVVLRTKGIRNKKPRMTPAISMKRCQQIIRTRKIQTGQFGDSRWGFFCSGRTQVGGSVWRKMSCSQKRTYPNCWKVSVELHIWLRIQKNPMHWYILNYLCLPLASLTMTSYHLLLGHLFFAIPDDKDTGLCQKQFTGCDEAEHPVLHPLSSSACEDCEL